METCVHCGLADKKVELDDETDCGFHPTWRCCTFALKAALDAERKGDGKAEAVVEALGLISGSLLAMLDQEPEEAYEKLEDLRGIAEKALDTHEATAEIKAGKRERLA